ncbi:unnamed protein product [Strongylus vulgaris]|uniref:Thiolase N-terminal domain-containing protein n=1 Tax=Strongylus vulgaris TaxID=40348 RepID=A0A3P7KGX7_STRVU|nr:unnamed protein product [Strongylus vulgaris]
MYTVLIVVETQVFLLSGVRTPIASFRGSFSTISATELAATAARAAIERSGAKTTLCFKIPCCETRSGINPEEIEESFVGCVLTANCGQNVARQVALSVGIPNSSQAVTVNKVCSSSMKALAFAHMSIKCGYRKKVLVAGCENMSQVPFYLERNEIPYGGTTVKDGLVRDGLEDPTLKQPMGLCAEKSAKMSFGLEISYLFYS